MLFTKRVRLNWYSSMIFFLRDSDDFWYRKFTLKVHNWHFLTNCHQMETQNLVISFDYSWFLAKNLACAECPIMKFHYRNSSNNHYLCRCRKVGKTPFGLLLHFRLTLPAWGQYFGLLLNFHLQVLQNFCLHLNFHLPHVSRKTQIQDSPQSIDGQMQ